MRCGRKVSGRLAAVIGLGLALALLGSPPALAQSSKDAAMKDYEETLVRAAAASTSRDSFEAVRLYERAGRVAYNNKLDVDKAALDQKLAAARQARDAKKQAPGAPAAPPTNADAMKDYGEAVARGDALASAGEYLLAVKEYERARRLIYYNKLVVDGVVLESKIAAAGKARDTGRPASNEIVPAPLPPVPRTPGYEGAIAFLPERPGKVLPWTLHREGFVVSDMRATATELAALEANLKRLSEVVLRAPPIQPPRGFDVYVSASLGHIESETERKAYLTQHMPLIGDFLDSFPSYFQRRSSSSKVGTKDDLTCALRFYFNSLPMPGLQLEDAEGTFLPEPRMDGEIGGQPV
jgi:tetratricopeptide (TPR) repeat protein